MCAVEAALAAFLNYRLCKFLVTVLDVPCIMQGFKTQVAMNEALLLLNLVSRVYEFNQCLRGKVGFDLQGSPWYPAQAMTLSALTGKGIHHLAIGNGWDPHSVRG